MITLGLTGSIGMGKTTVAGIFYEAGAAVLDSDSVVHSLMAPGGLGVKPVTEAFPKAVVNETINRKLLGAEVFADPKKLKKLEEILHPLVWQVQAGFAQAAKKEGRGIVVFDIPLLFETGSKQWCDYTVVVTAPYDVQRARVLARPDMTEERFSRILARQMPDEEKRRLADFIVHTGTTIDDTRKEVQAIIVEAARRSAERF